MSDDQKTEITKDEFLVLLRHNIMSFFSIYNQYNPNEYDMTVSAFDDLSASYEKMTKYIDLSYGEMIDSNLAPIKNSKIIEETMSALQNVYNIGELKEAMNVMNDMIQQAENKYELEQSEAYAFQKMNGAIFDVLYQHDMIAKQDSVDIALKSLLKECGMPQEYYPKFYRAIVKNKHNSDIMLKILSDTCIEYSSQPNLSREEMNIECSCKRKNGKNSYPRKSFALLVASNASHNNNDARALTVYECPDVKNAWHITHEPKTR